MLHAIIVAVAIVVGVGARWFYQKDTCIEEVAEAVIQAETGVPVDFGGKQPFKKMDKQEVSASKAAL